MTLRVWRFLEAVRDFVEDGLTTVNRDQYRERLTICQHCPTRDFLMCSEPRGGCGCAIHLKAVARSSECPQNRWPAIPVDQD